MTTSSLPRLTRFALAGLAGLAACSTAGDLGPTSIKAPSSARYALGATNDPTPVTGQIKVCKSSDSNVSGSFTASRTQFVAVGFTPPGSPSGSVLANATLAPGECTVIAEDNGGNGIASDVVITETPAADLVSVSVVGTDAGATYANGGTLRVNSFHGYTITFKNVAAAPPPPAICDFITFGRLVVELNGQKVVISGNAGGNAPGGGFLNEFHIEANGVDNHVADIDSYGPISSGALSGLTNSRIATGTAKNGVAVELRLWDGGEPGKGTDKVYVKLNGVELFGANGAYIDQGNMQYHPNCRGPK